MPSPFPGMNPFLEQLDVWHDFHQAFTAAMRAALTPQLRPNYITKIDENVSVHEISRDQRLLLGRPDVAGLEGQPSDGGLAIATASEARAIGKLLPLADRITESFIEIRDSEDRDLITIIELLSPANKQSGSDREQYLAKRRLLLSGNVHLVEIDLLRGGTRMPVEGLSDCQYCVMVSRAPLRPKVELWPISLREPLPVIPIPLKPEHPDARLDLQTLLYQQFNAAGYGDYIYSGKPRPMLSKEDSQWANGILERLL